MEVFHFYDFTIVTLSLNEIVLGQFERDLGSHMIIEHIIFFSIGALSVCVASEL